MSATFKFSYLFVLTCVIWRTLPPANILLLQGKCISLFNISYVSHIQGTPDYLGRTFAFPLLKLPNETYEPPMFPALLQWWPIMRGQAASGELLASFELMQVS